MAPSVAWQIQQAAAAPVGLVGEPAQHEALPIFFAHTVAIVVDPASAFKQRSSSGWIIAFCLNSVTAKAEIRRKRACSSFAVANHQRLRKALLINAEGNGLAHSRIAGDRAVEIHRRKKRAASGAACETIVTVFKQRIAGIGHTVGAVDLSGLEGHGQGVAVGDGQHGHVVKTGFPIQ